jgi:hypothetical protein
MIGELYPGVENAIERYTLTMRTSRNRPHYQSGEHLPLH